jgi:hypothetical protein
MGLMSIGAQTYRYDLLPKVEMWNSFDYISLTGLMYMGIMMLRYKGLLILVELK